MSDNVVVVTKNYEGNFNVKFPEPALFPNALHSIKVDAICHNLIRPTEEVGENFLTVAIECIHETTECAREGRVEQLTSIRDQHVAALQEHFTEGHPEPQHSNENQFIADYSARLAEIETSLREELTPHQTARSRVLSMLPTFIYMDDYKTFRGRADLAALKERQDNGTVPLSEEDETFLMILELSGLDLDCLIEQGKSKDQDIIHDRQIDLQDAGTTLTNIVAGRWGQNEYRVQFRVDGQVFFTEIEETHKNIGMIPLEEQSKGFQWFFSFDMHFMHDSAGTFEGCVLLLDEPGLHLHPGGQADLLERLDAYANKNTLLYTTHLPFLVDLREPERIKVISQTKSGAVVSDDLGGTQADERLTLQAALGMRAQQSYLVSDRNLLVEGVHDYWIITALSNLLEREERAGLPADVLITAAGGAPEIIPTATFMIGQNLNVVALFDSDSAGKIAEEKLCNKWITRYKDARAVTLLLGDALGMAGKEATIEDLFEDAYYMEKVYESHELKLKRLDLTPAALGLSGAGPILPRLRQCCDELKVDFNKGSAGKLIRRDLIRCQSVDELPPGVAQKGRALLTALRAAFDSGS